MLLFTFAHRGEAQEFLGHKAGNFQPVTGLGPPYSGLFQSHSPSPDGDLLLITGEGIQKTTETLAVVCAHYSQRLKGIINIGVAGALDHSLELGQVVQIRTSYLEPAAASCTKSFTSPPPSSSFPLYDCLTAQERVTTLERSHHLSCFAPVVDRELWAVASVAQLFRLPFHSYKLLIDHAGLDTCQQHQGLYLDYGRTLWKTLRFLLPEGSGEPKADKEAPEISLELEKSFYFTTTQKRQYQSLLETGRRKFQCSSQEVLAKINIEEIITSLPHLKKRTQKLLQALNGLINPFESRLKKRLDELCLPVTRLNGQVQFSPQLEDPTLRLLLTIKSEEDFRQWQAALAQFPYREIHHLLQGEGGPP